MLLFTTVPIFLAGCAVAPPAPALPPYAWTTTDRALADLAFRQKIVKAVTAKCDLSLTSPDGKSVQFEAAVAMFMPKNLRLRAWKFGQPVLDITVAPDGVWLWTSQPDKGPDQADPTTAPAPAPSSAAALGAKPSAGAARAVQSWTTLLGTFFGHPDLKVLAGTDTQLMVGRKVGDVGVVCTIDRATLTARRFVVLDESAAERFRLDLDDYAKVRDVPWPRRITATGPMGTIVVKLSEIEINGQLPLEALAPPKRAEKLP